MLRINLRNGRLELENDAWSESSYENEVGQLMERVLAGAAALFVDALFMANALFVEARSLLMSCWLLFVDKALRLGRHRAAAGPDALHAGSRTRCDCRSPAPLPLPRLL